MLRKAMHLITACLLLVSTTGFGISEHYCGENLVSVEMNTEAESCCDADTCCQTVTRFFQLDDDFISGALSYAASESSSFSDILSYPAIDLFPENRRAFNSKLIKNTSPPPAIRSLHAFLQSFLL